MPVAAMQSIDEQSETPKKIKSIESAYDSASFESDGSIHVDGLVGSATISPSGRDVALASPDGLAVIDLDSPYNPPRRLKSHGLPWLVCDVQWSPFAARDYWVVSTANHRALVWNLNLREDSNSGAVEHSLQGHSRAITDLNFSAHHPDTLATCSVDGYVHWWDLRRPRQPVLTFCDWFAGATQVKFNRQNPHILASAHDRFLHIWDDRKSSIPVKSISAHTSKIYGVDWNRTRSTGIVTCSLDKTIRFWDYGKDEDEQLEHIIRTDFPVWRARHTPFGWGLLAMPQDEPGDLYLYDRIWTEDAPVESSPKPVTVFSGHGDYQAKEFLWRSRGCISDDDIDHREFQLVSWGTDNELRLHCLDESIYSAVGHVRDGPAKKGVSLTRQGAAYKTFRTLEDSSTRDVKAVPKSDELAKPVLAQGRKAANSLGGRAGGQMNRSVQPAWRGPAMKAKVDSERHVDQSKAQIGWMKGITMIKRHVSTHHFRCLPSQEHDPLGHDYPDNEWGQPDTIQEELLRISTQIPKVQWENIDLDDLTLNASLTGPWGANEELIFVKVKIDVPSDYPKLTTPKFTIEKTSFMPDDTHDKIMKDVHMLADRFLARKQNCLEVVFTYLLGEVDLESSTTFFKNVGDVDDYLDGLADDSSSGDDEDIPPGGSALMSQQLPNADEDTTLAAMRHRNVPPPPRTCGAHFSHDGRLVCFFPTLEEKARALPSTASDISSNKDRPKIEPVFAGFGRLALDIPLTQKCASDEASATDDLSDSSDGDTSPYSSSSSSDSSSDSSGSGSTSFHQMKLWYKSTGHLGKTWGEGRSIRSSGGTGPGTGTSSRRRFGRQRNLISIYDMRSELPSKMEFAGEYIVFGDGAEVCEHNAQVAEKYGNGDLTNIWRYLAILLSKGVPLQVLSHGHERPSVLIVAHAVVSNNARRRRSGSRRGPKKISSSAADGPSLKGRVKWGQHPLARELIVELFDHFERMADIQMLAMMSCVFSEPQEADDIAYAGTRLRHEDMPLAMKAPGFSLEYFPTRAAAEKWSAHMQNRTKTAATTPAKRPIHAPCAGSRASGEVIGRDDPEKKSHASAETAPVKVKAKPEASEPARPVVSKSPTPRGILKGSGGIASAFAIALPKSFVRSGNSSSSPVQVRKRLSPVEYILNTFTPTAQPPLHASEEPGVKDTALSDEDHKENEVLPLAPKRFKIIEADQSIFDDDGWLNKPLLEPKKAGVYAKYRYAYANMLQKWDQPVSGLEVMKFSSLLEPPANAVTGPRFNNLKVVRDEGSAAEGHKKTVSRSPMSKAEKEQLEKLIASQRGLDVIGICRVHETQLEPIRYTSSHPTMGGAVGSCDRCRKVQNYLICAYCLDQIGALFTGCLACGCVYHIACLGEWHAAGETLCPAGDECDCIEEAANAQVESWAALRGALMKRQPEPNTQPLEQPTTRLDGIIDSDDLFARERSDWEPVEFDLSSLRRERREQDAAAAPPPPPPSPPPPPALSFGRLKQVGAWTRATTLRQASKRSG
ncbi:hypothetical protein E4U56_000081 [Claviceps arundinis]|uniref:WD repeat protein n=2 Tax=Claviceps arundinis TaxID=1623583 RepID=A0A9P7N365_9HYPO|nr:hypothetical protein E4U56_000081 [Claviceps arundinis]